MNRVRLILPMILAAWAAGSWAADGKAEDAPSKMSMCIGCHGIPGYKTTFPNVYHVPKLGGQHPDYIVKALQAYKAGKRSHPTMRSIAGSLSDQDMADIAAYYGAAN